MNIFSLFLIIYWITSLSSANNEGDNYHFDINHGNNDENRHPHYPHHNHQLYYHHYYDNRLENERRYENQPHHNEHHHYHYPHDVQHHLGKPYHPEGLKHMPMNEGDHHVESPQHHQQNERQPINTDYREKNLIPPKSTPAEPYSPARQKEERKDHLQPVQHMAPTSSTKERESPNKQQGMEINKRKVEEHRNNLPEKNEHNRHQQEHQHNQEPKHRVEQAENKSTEHRSDSSSPTENNNEHSRNLPKPVTLLRGASMVQSTEHTEHRDESNQRTHPDQTPNNLNSNNNRQPELPHSGLEKPDHSLESYKESSEHKYPTHQPEKSKKHEKLTDVNRQRSSEDSNQHPKLTNEGSFSQTHTHETKRKTDDNNRPTISHSITSVSFVSGTTKYDSPKSTESKLSSTNTGISSESLKMIKSEIEKALQKDLQNIVLKLQKTKDEENKKTSTPSPKPTPSPSETSPPIIRNDENVGKHYESMQHGIPQRHHDEDYARKPRYVRSHHEWDHHDRRDDEHEPREPEEREHRSEKHEPRPPFRDRDIPLPHHHHHPSPSHHPFPPKPEDESRNLPPIHPLLYQRHIRLSHESNKRNQEMPYESHPSSEDSPSSPNRRETNYQNSYQSKLPPRNQQKPRSIIQSASSTINGTHQLIEKDYTTILDSVSIPLSINIDDYSSSGCPFTPCNTECKGSLYKLNITTGCPTCQCCNEVKCTKLCTHGYEADDYGCPTCKCLAPIASYY